MLDGLPKNEAPSPDHATNRNEKSNVVELFPNQEELDKIVDRIIRRYVDPERQEALKEEMANVIPHSVEKSEADRRRALSIVFERYVEKKYAKREDGVMSIYSPNAYDGERGMRFLLGHDISGEILGTFGIVMDIEDDPSSLPTGDEKNFTDSTIPDKVASLQRRGIRLMEAGQFASTGKDMSVAALLKARDVVKAYADMRGVDAIVVQIHPDHYGVYEAAGFQLLAQGWNSKVNAPAGLFWLPISSKAKYEQELMTDEGDTLSGIRNGLLEPQQKAA